MVGWESGGRDGRTISLSGGATLDVRKHDDRVSLRVYRYARVQGDAMMVESHSLVIRALFAKGGLKP